MVDKYGVQSSKTQTITSYENLVIETYTTFLYVYQTIKTTNGGSITEIVKSYADWTGYAIDGTFSYTASAPCCSTCTLYGDKVEVYYWPTSTSSTGPAISKLVNNDGFTL